MAVSSSRAIDALQFKPLLSHAQPHCRFHFLSRRGCPPSIRSSSCNRRRFTNDLMMVWNPFDNGRDTESFRDDPTFRHDPNKEGESSAASPVDPAEMRRIEREVEAAALARIDHNQVRRVILSDENKLYPQSLGQADERPDPPSKWSIALAAGSAAAGVLFVVTQSMIPSGFSFILVATYAIMEDDESGVFSPLARILGRATITSASNTKKQIGPKVKAAIRAAATGEEEFTSLQKRVSILERENEELKLWKLRRQAVDNNIHRYGLEELKSLAKQNKIPFSGRAKAQLLMRLLHEEIVLLEDLTR